jgi:glycosyltransferase involved in cell wall biosynthesis
MSMRQLVHYLGHSSQLQTTRRRNGMNKSSQLAPVSVIIPCYRCLDTVQRALDSVLNQTLQPAEILLIDDASADGTLELLHKLENVHSPKVRVIAQGQNGGPGLARNAGWEAATQPWLAFLDADDAWHPRKLEIQWAWLSANVGVVLCGHRTRMSEDGRIDHQVAESPSATSLTPAKMLVSNRLPTRSVMMRRDLPFRFRGRDVTEDYLLWMEVITGQYKSVRLELCLAYSFRPEFSPGGYSGQLWAHERRELKALKILFEENSLTLQEWMGASILSLFKYGRRLWIS